MELPSYCLTRDNITKVYLEGNKNDKWLVASVATYFAGSDEQFYPLTENLDLYEILDNNDEIILTPFQEPQEGCIHKILIVGSTGRDANDHFSVPDKHSIVFTLVNGSQVPAILKKPAHSGKPYATTLTFAAASPECVRVSDINSVHLQAGSDDGWYISSLATAVQVGRNSVQALTEDTRIGSFIDTNNGRRKSIDLHCLHKTLAFPLPSL